MKNLTHDQITDLTVVHAEDGIIFAAMKSPTVPTDLIHVGTVREEFANLLGASAHMYRILTHSIAAYEANLEIFENEGLDKAAYDVTQLITAMKLVQKSAIDGPSALTAIRPNAK